MAKDANHDLSRISSRTRRQILTSHILSRLPDEAMHRLLQDGGLGKTLVGVSRIFCWDVSAVKQLDDRQLERLFLSLSLKI